VTQGAILDGVSDAQLTRLDTYEGAFGYQLIDVTVTTAAGDVAAKMYLPPADIAVGDGAWSFAQWQTNCEATAVLAATELFSHDPPMTKPHIAAQFHMIEKRAWAKACGAQTSAPATLRQKATPVEIVNAAPPQGTFFRIQQMHIQHQRFDGDTSENAYLGLCDLPDDRPQFGGLASEAEDLRLHMISFDAAMDLVASGEINAGPLVMMLSMLALRRDALRKAV